MKRPRVGSAANACTDVSTPERTRKVPSSDSENAQIASSTVHALNVPRFSVTASECTRAVPAVDGPGSPRAGKQSPQSRPAEPRHERGVLHRIPEPPAAPAELVIGP